MKVLIVSEGEDTGGVAIAIKRAFDRHGPGIEVRAVRADDNYIDYPTDLTVSWQSVEFDYWYEWADVIHAMERVHFLVNRRAKPTILHHHGTIYRDDHEAIAAWAAEHGVPQFASTVDLLRWDPAVAWLPNPVNVDWLRGFRSQYAPTVGRAFTVGHTPTQRHMKGTAEFIEAMDGLPGIESYIAERRPWGASLADKARCDAYFDQNLYGYGLSGIECMAMGIPVIGAFAAPELSERLRPFPFVEAGTADEIRDAIRRLAFDPAFQRTQAELGQAFVAMFHDERRTVTALTDIYTRTADHEPARNTPRQIGEEAYHV
jgi:hypothetical protein